MKIETMCSPFPLWVIEVENFPGKVVRAILSNSEVDEIVRVVSATRLYESGKELDNSLHCKWKYDLYNEAWETGCGNAFVFISSTPTENNMNYCPFCGRIIDEILEADKNES